VLLEEGIYRTLCLEGGKVRCKELSRGKETWEGREWQGNLGFWGLPFNEKVGVNGDGKGFATGRGGRAHLEK